MVCFSRDVTRPGDIFTTSETKPDFFDDFEDGLDDAWTIEPIQQIDPDTLEAEWIGDKGRARVSGQAVGDKQACGLITIGDAAWDRMAVDFDLAMSSAKDDVLAVIPNYDRSRLMKTGQAGEALKYVVVIACNPEKDACGIYFSGVSNSDVILKTKPSHIRIEISGKKVRVLADDQLVYDYGLGQSLAGKIGVLVCASKAANSPPTSIDNFRISPLQP